jgi:6-phosphofructokinase 1
MHMLVIVSGGDAPGINAALFHLADQAAQYNHALIGARGGFAGVLTESFVPLGVRALVPLIGVGGSFLPSSRVPVLADADNRARFAQILRDHAFDAVILFGGGGTLHHIPPILSEMGIMCACIPTTIDNDVPGTQLTLGFHSAVDFAMRAVDGIRATAHALEGRLFTLETLGGDCGNLAQAVAFAAGADGVLIPEYSHIDDAAIAQHLRAALDRKGHALLVYNEYIADKNALIERIAAHTGVRLRDTRLGHAQRGGSPSSMDRFLAKDWAHMALSALQQSIPMSMTVYRDGGVALHHGLLTGDAPRPDAELYRRLNGLRT